jgi:hypothetical protein
MDLGDAVLTLKIDGKEYTYQLGVAKDKTEQLEKSNKTTEKSFGDLKKTITGVTAVITTMVVVATQLIKAWAGAETAAKRLSAAAEITGQKATGLSDRLLAYGEELQKTSGFEHELTQNLMAQAVFMGRSEEETKSLTLAATKLANGMGIDVNTAFETLMVTYDGMMPRNKVLKAMIGELTEEQLKNGDAITIVNKKFGDINAQMMATTQGGLTSLKNGFDELKEALGRSLSVMTGPLMAPAAELMNNLADKVNKVLENHKNLLAILNKTSTASQDMAYSQELLASKEKELNDISKIRNQLAKDYGLDAPQYKDYRDITAQTFINLQKEITVLKEAIPNIQKKMDAEKKAAEETLAAQKKVDDALKASADAKAKAIKDADDAQKQFEADRSQFYSVNVEEQISQNDAIILANKKSLESEQEIAREKIKSIEKVDHARQRSIMDIMAEEAATRNAMRNNIDERTAYEIKAWADMANKVISVIQSFANQISAIFSQITANQMADLSAWYAAEKARIDSTITDETAKTEALKALDKDYAKKKYDIEVASFNTNKALQVANIAINTASAIIRAFIDMPFWIALGVSAGIGILGAVQAGLVLAQAPPPPPAFAAGGSFDVPPGYPDDSFAMQVQSGEHVDVTPAGEDAGQYRVIVNLNGKAICDFVTRATRDRQILINAGAVV